MKNTIGYTTITKNAHLYNEVGGLEMRNCRILDAGETLIVNGMEVEKSRLIITHGRVAHAAGGWYATFETPTH